MYLLDTNVFIRAKNEYYGLDVARWVMTNNGRYSQQARTGFLSKADYRLVAAAAGGRHVVVTHETPAPDAVRVIKIPDACAAFNAECREPFQLFGELGLRLVRPPKDVAV
jgi:hypothetical protein